MSHVRATEILLQSLRNSVIESYAGKVSTDLKPQLDSLHEEVSNIEGLVDRIKAHGALDPPSSSDVSDEDTLFSLNQVYRTTEGSVTETSVAMPISGEEISVIIDDSSVTLPELTATAVIDKRYPVVLYINILRAAGDENIQIDTSKIGKDDSSNPELYGVDIVEDNNTYTLSFPRDISCVDIIRSKGLLSTNTSMTRAYRTAASLTSLLSGSIRRIQESMALQITEQYVEDAPYTLFYIYNSGDVYVVDEGDITLIKGRTPASSLTSGTYTIVRESVAYSGKALVQSGDVTHTREEAYVEDVNLDEGDEIINGLGQVAIVTREGNLSRHIGEGRLVYATQSRLLRSTSDVSSAPEIENVHKKIDNDRLSEIYEYTSLVSTYINSVIRCCDELASMPVEYPIVTDIIRLHRRMGYDRAADLLSELMFDDYESVSESESSYESMLAEHTKTLQVKVVT